MADDIVIRAEGLGKKYVIGHETERERYVALRDVIARGARNAWRMAADMVHGRVVVPGDTVEDLWALKDVSFEVKRGEVLGIIGRNGAGKSTLLKILSRITEPTEGRVTIKGRVASLLEVGTGFHPELTGRENISLNGAILGMTRAEIKRKFDEIVDFAEIDKFLDTPVKRYSSGMYVRLAFAVAAHLEPEILIVDEVLAVGDVAFQRKCLGKMRDVATGGRTVLFVSHNMSAVSGLTSRSMLMERGGIVMSGSSSEVISYFLRNTQEEMQASGDLSPYRRPYRTEGYVDFESVRICDANPGAASVSVGEAVVIELVFRVWRPLESGLIAVSILNEQMEVVTSLLSTDNGLDLPLEPGLHSIQCKTGPLPLMPGDYRLNVGIAESRGTLCWDVLEPLPGFRVEAKQFGSLIDSADRTGVLLLAGCTWTHRDVNATELQGRESCHAKTLQC
jgi:lipopolysaccharide transport system ATP-binding protein